MKIIHKIILAAATLLLSVSCAKEENIVNDDEPVTITIGAAMKAAGDASGTDEDYYINSFRMLGYRSSTGILAFNEMVFGLPATSTANRKEIEEYVNVKTGNFTIVFIANEHSDPALSAALQAIDSVTNNTLAHLRTLAFLDTAFDTNKNIPMSAIFQNISIYSDNTLLDPTNPAHTAPVPKWTLLLTRLGIRIDIKLTLTEEQKDAWLGGSGAYKVNFNNVPKKVYIFPDIENSSDRFTNFEKEVTLTPATPPQDPYYGLTWIYRGLRIILPETNSPALLESEALTMRIMEGATPRTGVITTTGAGVYTIPRNHYINVKAGMSALIVFDATVLPWMNILIEADDIQGPIQP